MAQSAISSIKAKLPGTESRLQSSYAAGTRSIRSADVRSLQEGWGGASTQDIRARLQQLDKEWDIERTLMFNASVLASLGVWMGLAKGSLAGLLLAGTVTLFLLQHAVQGWCPPLPMFRSIGVRTAGEIHDEALALHLLAGDLDELVAVKQGARGASASASVGSSSGPRGAQGQPAAGAGAGAGTGEENGQAAAAEAMARNKEQSGSTVGDMQG